MLMEMPNSNIIRRDDLGGNKDESSVTAETKSESGSGSLFVDFADKPVPEGITIAKYRGGITTHFPALLHAMLTRAKADGYDEVCSWKSHGRSFAVYDRDSFVKDVMPKYFRQSQFASFQRQLNLYGFQRLSSKGTAESGAYYHALFLRSRHDLCPAIQRSTEKELRESKTKLTKDEEKRKALLEPDFSKMNAMPEIGEEEVKQARRVTNPQRKAPPPPSSLEPKVQSLKAPALGDGDMFAVPALPEENAVDNAYASIFLSQDEPDMSWMEPRPIAPEAESQLHTAAVLSGSPPSAAQALALGNEMPLDPLALPTHVASTPSMGQMSLPPPPLESEKTHLPTVKRSRSSRTQDTSGMLSRSPQDDGMVSFLHDVDLSDVEEAPPPSKLLNLSLSSPAGMNGLHAMVKPVMPLPSSSNGSGALWQNNAQQRISQTRPRPQVKLPRSFQGITEFPLDEPLMVTKSFSPFPVVYVNSSLEKAFSLTREKIMDKPLQGMCQHKSDTIKLCAAAGKVRQLQSRENGVTLSFACGNGNLPLSCEATLGPFFMSDLSQIHDLEFIVWHFNVKR
mmetsp:Transcript_9238/g.19194  ORF Transcript_9238/g.19194 Transcript_9238/m.19194 type:complete len:566 (-) Transcript_9238:2574-4271(-)